MTLCQGTYDSKNGLVVVTDRRVMFVEEGMGRSRLEDFPYGRVSSVQTSKAWTVGEVVIFASGNKAIIRNVMPKDGATEIGDYIRARISEGTSAPSPSVPSAAQATEPDVYDQLRKLGELRDAGVLTPEEFEAKKTTLLERL